MAAQGERGLGDIVMGEGLLDPVAQDIPEQEMLVVEEEQFIPPQMDLEPEMGAAAAAVCDAPPPHLRQSPSPTPGEPMPNGEAIAADPHNVGQLLMVLLAQMNEVKNNANETREEIKKNAKQMKEETKGMREEMKEMRGEMQNMGVGLQDKLTEVKDEMKKMRGEMRQIGRGLQAGTARIVAVARGEARTTAGKRVTPRAGTNELGGSATAVRPAMEAGEEKIIRETYWARSVEVTEKVTVTQREKVNGVTEANEAPVSVHFMMCDCLTGLTCIRESLSFVTLHCL